MSEDTPREETPREDDLQLTPPATPPATPGPWYEPYDSPTGYVPPGAVPPGPVPPGAVPPGTVPPGTVPPGGFYGPFPPPDVPAGARIRRRRHTHPAVAAALVVGTIAASAAVAHEVWPSGATRAATSTPSGSATPSPASNTQGDGAPADVSSIAAKVDPAVVDIYTTLGYQGAQGAGTGIVLTANGEILTNNHVIDGATSIKVTDVGNGRTYQANVAGYDSSHDVAVLQLVGASGLTTAHIGDSGSLKVGQAVVAVGNAGGAGGTPSAAGGSITALNQTITASDQLDGTSESLSNLIETNANVQSGDSGGPLVDTSGRVIGMDTAAATGYSLQSALGATSQAYAIPINQAISIADQIESGRASSTVHIGSTAFLGVMISSSSSPYSGGSTSFGSGSDGSGSSTAGAAVANVVSGGAADRAGLVAGDVITSIDGSSVTSPDSLSGIIAADRPGQRISITWTGTDGASHTATATLQSGPPA